ncbi:MAG: permease [Bacillota bacterium]
MFNWLEQLMGLIVVRVFGLSLESRIGASLHFFLYDTVKIIILLGVMIFAISYIRSYFPPERTKRILTRFKGVTGNIMAALLGTVTPFCSCSSVPLFIGFVEAGIPLGVTLSFLITSPIVNEAAFAILVGSFGLKIAVIYVVAGTVLGVLGGLIIGKLKMEDQIEEYVKQIKMGETEIQELTTGQRIAFARDQVADIVKRVWVYILIGIGIGALIHGYAPAELLAEYAGPDNPFAVIVAVVLGVPLYSNALGTIPIAEALINKGVGFGTAMAFMMATTALSLPEMIILRKVIKPKLIATFVVVTSFGIILIGYLFNFLV